MSMLADRKCFRSVFIAALLAMAAVALSAQWAFATELTRYAGQEAVDTAVESSKAAFPDGTTCDYAVIARNDDFMDSMSSTGLAGALEAPILLTDRESLSDATAAEIKRLGVKKVYIIGGTAAINPKVDDKLKASKIEVERVCGEEAYDTSYECAKKIQQMTKAAGKQQSKLVFVATSYTFQDSLSIASVAYKNASPILIQTYGPTSVERGLTNNEIQLLQNDYKDAKVFVPGGPGAVSTSSVEDVVGSARTIRVFGNDGYDTSGALATYFVENGYLEAKSVGIANGEPDPKGVDALTSAAVCAKNNAPLILVDNTNTSKTINGYLIQKHSDISGIMIFGGKAVVSDSVADTARKCSEGSIRWVVVSGIDNNGYEGTEKVRHQGSDVMMLMRVDTDAGTMSFLSIPRDTYYNNTFYDANGTLICPGAVCNDHGSYGGDTCNGMTWQKCNYAFHYAFYQTYNYSGEENYDAAMRAGGEALCKMVSNVTGLPVTDYLYTDFPNFTNVVNYMGGLTVDVPMYVESGSYKFNEGVQTVDGTKALVLSRERHYYYDNYVFDSLAEARYPNLANYYFGAYHYEMDGTRQYVNRRNITALARMVLRSGISSTLLEKVINKGYLSTNISSEDIAAMTEAMSAHKTITVHNGTMGDIMGATRYADNSGNILWDVDYDPSNEAMSNRYGLQYMIPYNEAAFKDRVAEAANGQSISGYGSQDETI